MVRKISCEPSLKRQVYLSQFLAENRLGYPREVGGALLAHPAVLECAVVGALDEKWVDAVTAFVILRPGQAAQESERFRKFENRFLQEANRIVFTQDIPKTAVGQLDRKVLRNRLKNPAVS